MTAAPAVVAIVGLAVYAALDPWLVALVALATTAAIAVMVHRRLAEHERLRSGIASLARGLGESGVPETAEADTALAALGRRLGQRGDELQALIAANDTILEAIPDPLILIDAGRRVARTNAAARTLLGENATGRDLDTVLRHPDVLAAVDEHLAGQFSVTSVDLPWAGPPERHFNVRFARLALPQGGGEQPGNSLLLVLHDVTPLKRAERMRADFVANVSHELRTPLSALLGFVETLRGPARDDAGARERFLAIMHDQAQRMTRLVRDLLSLSRIEQSEHTPPTEPVALGPLIGSVVDSLALQAKSKPIAVELDVPLSLPRVTGDADQLAQVFQNLLDNAIKYGRPNGKVRVVAQAAASAPARVARGGTRGMAPPGAWVSVAVADDGEGIAREHLSRLTERFYRVDAARSRQLGGTGLGLAIVKHILNRHRGGLIIDSEPGRGAVFTVWLPAAEPGRRDAAA